MTVALPNKTDFDAKRSELEALARDWAERECTTFDAAVRKASAKDPGEGSIWDDMPEIDSKRTVSLLVELEPVLGCKLPPSVIKAGGYASVDDLISKLFSKIRERCPDAPKPGLVSGTTPAPASKPPASQVLP
jgi:hypothetical protein